MIIKNLRRYGKNESIGKLEHLDDENKLLFLRAVDGNYKWDRNIFGDLELISDTREVLAELSGGLFRERLELYKGKSLEKMKMLLGRIAAREMADILKNRGVNNNNNSPEWIDDLYKIYREQRN